MAIVGRSEQSRGEPLAAQYGVAYVTSLGDLLAHKPDVVVEAASHDAVREYCGALLDAGVAVIVLSGGALCDDALRDLAPVSMTSWGQLVLVASKQSGFTTAADLLDAARARPGRLTRSSPVWAGPRPPGAWRWSC